MKQFLFVVAQDLRRTMISWTFLFAVLGLAFVNIVTLFDEYQYTSSSTSILYLQMLMEYRDFYIVFLLFAALPGTTLFCSDWDNRSDDHVVLIVTLGAMLLFCDAPFIDLEQPYIVLRSGRKTWVWGQILYLAVASFLYTIFTFLMTLLLLLPKLELQFDWGKVIGTLVQTTTGSEFGISIPFDRYVYFGYSPMGATGISLLLCFSVVLFLGVLMFYLNLRVNRMVGTIASGLLILWQLVIRKTATVFVRLSPVSWMKLGQIDLDGSTLYPPLSYVMIGLYAMILIFCILSVLRIRKTNIDVLKSV